MVTLLRLGSSLQRRRKAGAALRGGGGDDVSLVTHVTHCSDDVTLCSDDWTDCSDDVSLVTHCSLSHMPQVAVILLYMCV